MAGCRSLLPAFVWFVCSVCAEFHLIGYGTFAAGAHQAGVLAQHTSGVAGFRLGPGGAASRQLCVVHVGEDLNLMLSRVSDEQAPMLWHGSHPVWMNPASGERCDRPADGAPLEAFCRRIRANLVGSDSGFP